jgi:hypothetical protein
LPDVYSYYGLALLRTGDAAGAEAAFTKELASNPNGLQLQPANGSAAEAG